MQSLGRTTPAVLSSLASEAEPNQSSALKSSSGSFSSHSSINNGNPVQTLPRYVFTGKRAAEVMQTQLQPLASNQAAASKALALGQSDALQHVSCCNPANKKKQKLAKNRATAALSRYIPFLALARVEAIAVHLTAETHSPDTLLLLSCRERKKAHLDVLQQRLSLLEKTNSSLREQLALRVSEVLQLKSRLGDIAGQHNCLPHSRRCFESP